MLNYDCLPDLHLLSLQGYRWLLTSSGSTWSSALPSAMSSCKP